MEKIQTIHLLKNQIYLQNCDEALRLINEFIIETNYLSYEKLLYFDYKTGRVIKMADGSVDSVKIEVDEEEFVGLNVASIHNHTSDLISPPSGKNFGILKRGFEDYELIAGNGELWILKAKGIYDNQILNLRNYSNVLYDSLKGFCLRHYSGSKCYDKLEEFYGKQLSEFINNKNIDNLKLTNVRYKK